MKTVLKSIEEWKKGNKEKAYQLYLQDEGSFGIIDFIRFCEVFPRIVKKHGENEEAIKYQLNCD